MCDSFAANLKKLLVGWRVEQLRIEGDLLDAESLFATLCRKKGKVFLWWFVDDAIGLSADTVIVTADSNLISFGRQKPLRFRQFVSAY